MRGLMRVLTASLGHPLRIIKYEGDAVLVCAPDHALNAGTLLLDLIDDTYSAFTDHVFSPRTCTTCTCRACGLIRALDLKFFLHHGTFILESGAKGYDLAGPDVILLHRLMKNTVKEATGVSAYLLATEPALRHLGVETGFRPHREHYDHFGDVRCGVADLRAAMEERRALRDVRVDLDSAQVIVERIVPGVPSSVWG